MPRRTVLSALERENLLALPQTEEELIRHYTLSEVDLGIIGQRRGPANRLGFAVQLCYLRFPGIVLSPDQSPFPPLLHMVADQLKISADNWSSYARRLPTRREHQAELQTLLGFQPFTAHHYQSALATLTELALRSDKGLVLASWLVEDLRNHSIILPAISTIERLCAEAITQANRLIYAALTDSLTAQHRLRLDNLLNLRDGGKTTWLLWLRGGPAKPNSRHMLIHIERLKTWRTFDLPSGLGREVHQNRLLKMAREGAQMTPADLAKFEPARRYATLAVLALEGLATVADEIIDLNDRILGKLFNAAKTRHQEQFQAAGKAINDKVRLYGRIGQALLEARDAGLDPFAAIEDILPWALFVRSVTEAQALARPESFDFLPDLKVKYATLKRYAPAFLNILSFKAAPAATGLMDGIILLRHLYTNNIRELPLDAPIGFIKPRWKKLVLNGLERPDRRYYELCLMSELKNALRSGDIWVEGSRQFKDFEQYLLPPQNFAALKEAGNLGLAVPASGDQFIQERLAVLQQQLDVVDKLAHGDQLPDAVINETGLKITPHDAATPPAAQVLIKRISQLLPHIKITELLQDVDTWTSFTRHFNHLKSGEAAKETPPLLAVILADAINLGLVKMAESCPGQTYAKMAWTRAWHVRDETYSAALADLVNTQYRHPLARHWGDGTTSSSDAQNFRAGGRAENTGQINPKYGGLAGRMFYTHVSDQYTPFHVKVINVGVRDSTFVLDGLLHHESDLRIEEHYTDTAGFTDHVFALMHLLGFRFAPRIRDLKDTKLYLPKEAGSYETLKPMIGGTIKATQIADNWDEIIRLAASIKHGTVTASLMLRKLGSYPRQNGLATALRELGRIERTLFILDWLHDVDLRRRVQAGLNKGEARHALARAVFFNRLGEIRDQNLQLQQYRARGLNLVSAAIILWNTVYIDRAIKHLRSQGQHVDDELLQYLAPLGWEHINLTGDYLWPQYPIASNKFRPLRTLNTP